MCVLVILKSRNGVYCVRNIRLVDWEKTIVHRKLTAWDMAHIRNGGERDYVLMIDNLSRDMKNGGGCYVLICAHIACLLSFSIAIFFSLGQNGVKCVPV